MQQAQGVTGSTNEVVTDTPGKRTRSLDEASPNEPFTPLPSGIIKEESEETPRGKKTKVDSLSIARAQETWLEDTVKPLVNRIKSTLDRVVEAKRLALCREGPDGQEVEVPALVTEYKRYVDILNGRSKFLELLKPAPQWTRALVSVL